MRRRLPIRVQSPCEEDWSAMSPRAEGRHCARCASTVIDLTRVTRAQAEAMVRERGGTVCGRVRANERGEAVFAPEPVRRGLVPMALAGLLAACTAEPAERETPPHADATHDDASAGAVGLAVPTTGGFGGSLATGVMMPLGPPAPELPARAVPTSIAPPPDAPVEPTPEQRALTRRKHQRQHPPSYPPITRPMMGAISLSDTDF